MRLREKGRLMEGGGGGGPEAQHEEGERCKEQKMKR